MDSSKRNRQGRPRKPARLKKRGLSFWMKEEMIEQLDRMKESKGLSSRGDMIRMLVESHPEYREASS